MLQVTGPMRNETFEEQPGRSAPASNTIKFKDSRGQIWRVSERERFTRDQGSVRMLIFESDTAMRCVRVYPDDWRRMEPEALEYLSWRT